MNNSLRNTLVVITSLLVGGIVLYLFETLIHQWFPMPADVDPSDIESLKNYMPNAPVGSLALLILTHAIAAFISGWIIAKFAKSNIQFLALITGMIWTLFGVTNIVMIPHPLWFSIADTCVFLPLTILGSKLPNS
ncbi:MAG: hypothetical protein IPN86_05650 [Saprospiraceae bacterium]|nr:hypothetical protein [Saprospiraceae bacterium]